MARWWIVIVAVVIGGAVGGGLAGCAANPIPNPAFTLDEERAEAELMDMRANRVPLERPLIVLGGYGDPGIFASAMAERFRETVTTPELVHSKAFFFTSGFEGARRALRKYLRAKFEGQTLEQVPVDVVGISMGGLIARYLAMDGPEGPGLDIRRIFTVSTPHRGADGADLPTLDAKVLDMRAGSDFLNELDAGFGDAEYELYCYVRLEDGIVGEQNASPEGTPLFWVDRPRFEFSHLDAPGDPRILADIARRLRGEAAYALIDGAPLPEHADAAGE